MLCKLQFRFAQRIQNLLRNLLDRVGIPVEAALTILSGVQGTIDVIQSAAQISGTPELTDLILQSLQINRSFAEG